MKRSGYLKTKGKRQHKGTEDPAHLEYIRSLPCAVSTKYGCDGDVVPHHDPTKGAGGHDRQTTSLCTSHHREVHDIGRKSFDIKYGVNLRELGKHLGEREA